MLRIDHPLHLVYSGSSSDANPVELSPLQLLAGIQKALIRTPCGPPSKRSSRRTLGAATTACRLPGAHRFLKTIQMGGGVAGYSSYCSIGSVRKLSQVGRWLFSSASPSVSRKCLTKWILFQLLASNASLKNTRTSKLQNRLWLCSETLQGSHSFFVEKLSNLPESISAFFMTLPPAPLSPIQSIAFEIAPGTIQEYPAAAGWIFKHM